MKWSWNKHKWIPTNYWKFKVYNSNNLKKIKKNPKNEIKSLKANCANLIILIIQFLICRHPQRLQDEMSHFNYLKAEITPFKKTSLLSGYQQLPIISVNHYSVTLKLLNSPLSQSNTSQLDQVSHTGSDDDGLLIRVSSLIIALNLLHHKLGMAQQRVLSETVKVEPSRRNSSLKDMDEQISTASDGTQDIHRASKFQSAYLNFVKQIFICGILVLLEKLNHNLAHVDLLLHQSKNERVLLTGVH